MPQRAALRAVEVVHEADAAPSAGRREWIGLGVLTLPTLLIGLATTVLYLAVPRLSVDLHPNGSQLLRTVVIYGFMIAGVLITMGMLGDRTGRRRLLLASGAAFGLASALAAFSPTPRCCAPPAHSWAWRGNRAPTRDAKGTKTHTSFGWRADRRRPTAASSTRRAR
jgi:hypothetical protein